ncbi:MAG TPA: DUF2917 domain-containing protein [Burkholderiaceae bacterium]|nr:DUF2917 domain-containing protein [Burkholderiaceae bacterium]
MGHQLALLRTLDLAGGTLVPFPSAGKKVRVLYGRVWLTEEGNPRDAFLGRGEEACLGRHGLAVIEALTPVRVQIFEAMGLRDRIRQGARRAANWLAALLEPQPQPGARGTANLKLAQALAQFDGSLGLVQGVKVQAGCAGRNQALA